MEYCTGKVVLYTQIGYADRQYVYSRHGTCTLTDTRVLRAMEVYEEEEKE